MSKKFPKTMLAALLISSVPRTTIPGAEPRIVGQVVESRDASLGGIAIPGASTILPGDVLETGHAGRALVTFSSGERLNLASDTAVSFERERSAFVARISRGDLLAEAHNPDALAIETPQYRISSDGARLVTCLVTVLADHRTLISARQGRISITDLRSGAVKSLTASEYLAMAAAPGQETEPSQPAPPKPAGQAPPPSAPAPATASAGTAAPAAAHKSNTGLILLLVGAGAAAGVGAAAAGGGHGGGGGAPVSPSAP
jgi:FecR protein